MSLSAIVPTQAGLRFRPHISAAPMCSMIFGQVLLAVQRSRMPAAGRPRTGSGHGHPPLRALAPGLVELQRAVGLRKPGIQRHAPARNNRPRAVMHFPVALHPG